MDTHSTQATIYIERAEQKCADSLKCVGIQLMCIRKAKDRVAMLTQAIDKIYEQEDKDDTQIYDDNTTKPWENIIGPQETSNRTTPGIPSQDTRILRQELRWNQGKTRTTATDDTARSDKMYVKRNH